MTRADPRTTEAELPALLQTTGAERFLRYRKRFLEPGIAREILAAEPALPLREADAIVWAGRRIVTAGLGLEALRRIRREGLDDAALAAWTPPAHRPSGDWLVRAGGLAFLSYLLLTLVAPLYAA
jgi:hypothetical protein